MRVRPVIMRPGHRFEALRQVWTADLVSSTEVAHTPTRPPRPAPHTHTLPLKRALTLRATRSALQITPRAAEIPSEPQFACPCAYSHSAIRAGTPLRNSQRGSSSRQQPRPIDKKAATGSWRASFGPWQHIPCPVSDIEQSRPPNRRKKRPAVCEPSRAYDFNDLTPSGGGRQAPRPNPQVRG